MYLHHQHPKVHGIELTIVIKICTKQNKSFFITRKNMFRFMFMHFWLINREKIRIFFLFVEQGQFCNNCYFFGCQYFILYLYQGCDGNPCISRKLILCRITHFLKIWLWQKKFYIRTKIRVSQLANTKTLFLNWWRSLSNYLTA